MVEPAAGPRFDVFLSHNSTDKPAVLALAERLKAEGLRVWLDLWELRPGHPWQDALEEIIETTRAAAVLVGADGIGPWEDAEIAACLDEFAKRKLPVIPVVLPDCPEPPDLPLLLRRFTWVDLRDGPEEEGFQRLIWGITGRKPMEQEAALQPEAPASPDTEKSQAREPTDSTGQTNPRYHRWFPNSWAILVMVFLGGAVAMLQWDGQRSEAGRTGLKAVDKPSPTIPNAGDLRVVAGNVLPAPAPPAKPFLSEPEMVSVPGGEFWMGSDRASDPNSQADERPRHKVRVNPFRIGKYEVTQGQWKEVMGSNPSYFAACGDDCPVANVSFVEAQEFVAKLNARLGKHYRLPTEAEWEYACRSGGLKQKYCGAGDMGELAWYSGNAGATIHPVGGKAPNGLGAYDMSGNVWEWTCSAYTKQYNGSETRCARGGPWEIRGGSSLAGPENLRSANRNWFAPGDQLSDLGFRLATD